MKYIKVEWPDIQEHMTRPDWKENHYYDPTKDSWFIPEEWETQEVNDIVDIMNIL